MDNHAISKLLRSIAAAYVIKGESRFKIIAYERAADSIEHATSEVKDLWEQRKLDSLPGIGSAMMSHLDELFRTGKVKHFTTITHGFPKAMFVLLEIPGFGPKKAYNLAKTLHLSDHHPIQDLKQAAQRGKIRALEGFGPTSEKDILLRIAEFEKGKTKNIRMVLPYAYKLAEVILEYLRQNKAVLRAEPLGSLRRMVSTIGDIDIAVVTKEPIEVLDWFTKYKNIERILERGPATASILVSGGRQIDLMVTSPDSFGALLQHFTGSKSHNIHLREYAIKKGLSLSEHGIKQKNSEKIAAISTEKNFYKALGMNFIPPEIREDRGEIEAAVDDLLPNLVKLEDIRGDLHIHSDYDLEPSHDLGKSSIWELLSEAAKIGYEYIGISDHNPSVTNHSEDEIIAIMKRRKAKFEQVLSSIKSVRVHLFIMLEIDILPDGELALPKGAFEFIDAAIVSVHSSFDQPKNAMTQRVLKALSQPKVKILGHPTGRLLEKREGYELEWNELFEFCKNSGKALEINAYPDRLDLPDSLVKQAIDLGVKLVIDTDSHRQDQLMMMRYGVSVARRGWAEKADIINTLPYNKFKDWLVNK